MSEQTGVSGDMDSLECLNWLESLEIWTVCNVWTDWSVWRYWQSGDFEHLKKLFVGGWCNWIIASALVLFFEFWIRDLRILIWYLRLWERGGPGTRAWQFFKSLPYSRLVLREWKNQHGAENESCSKFDFTSSRVLQNIFQGSNIFLIEMSNFQTAISRKGPRKKFQFFSYIKTT